MAAGLPAGLRERVLAAARIARAAGRPVEDAEPIPPAEAFARAADAFAALLESLDEPNWRVPVLRDLDVQGLVGHLIGVEGDVQRALAGDPAVADADHVAATQAAATAERDRAPALTCRSFRAATERTLASLGEPADGDRQPVAVHGMRLSRGELLVVRAFELWTHENDIRAAVGRPARVPDAATLRSMTDLAVAWLPLGVLRAAPDAGRVDVHLVLTGPGGGTWDLAVGRGGPAPARDAPRVPGVLVVGDAVDFCRLVADRARPDDVVRQIDGHVDDAAVVLAGARALALD
jgi:uncharacterized protein (TIGR03083 family)